MNLPMKPFLFFNVLRLFISLYGRALVNQVYLVLTTGRLVQDTSQYTLVVLSCIPSFWD